MNRQPDPDFTARLDEILDPIADGPEALRETPGVQFRPPSLAAESPTRAAVHRRRWAALLGSVSWLGLHLAVYGVRTDLRELPPAYVIAQIALPVVFASASLWVALGAGPRGLGFRVGMISALAVLGPAAFCAVALGAPVPRNPEAASFLDTLLCFDITAAWVAVPLLCAAVSLHGAFAAGARWRSALVGAGIGLFAGATMNLHCANVAPVHVLFGHGLAVVGAAALGALALITRTRA